MPNCKSSKANRTLNTCSTIRLPKPKKLSVKSPPSSTNTSARLPGRSDCGHGHPHDARPLPRIHARRFLIHPKCLHGINGGSATSGNNRRDQAADREQSTDRQERNRVVLADAKEKCPNGARGEPRGNEP